MKSTAVSVQELTVMPTWRLFSLRVYDKVLSCRSCGIITHSNHFGRFVWLCRLNTRILLVVWAFQNGSAAGLLRALLSVNTQRLCFRAQYHRTTGAARPTRFFSNYRIMYDRSLWKPLISWLQAWCFVHEVKWNMIWCQHSVLNW